MDNNFQGRPAPTLRWYGDKWNNQGSYDSKNNTGGFYFLMLPQPLIWNTLNGRNGLKSRIME